MDWSIITQFFTLDFLTALLIIIVIDLVLAGDNAIVIGLAARNLPLNLQKRAIIWGTAGAVIIRVVATIFVVYLLNVPGLLFIGGLMLIWIAYKLLVEQKDEHNIAAASNLGAAIRTIVIADALMGVDNVIAVAGAAKSGSDEHNLILVILGLLISIPIMVWGSTLVIKIIDRFPAAIYVGSGVLVLTAGKMMADETFLVKDFLADHQLLKWVTIIILMIAVLWFGWWKNKQSRQHN
jgi:YjbE family integral membrane protein